MNNIFFGEKGITSTTANYYANMAKELVYSNVKFLSDVSFYSSNIQAIGSSISHPYTRGESNLSRIESNLKEVSRINSLCAWLREAVKEKERQLNSIDSETLSNWMELNDKTLPFIPAPADRRYVNEEDIRRTWSKEKLNKYFQLEAIASTYGKFIHPEGYISKARADLYTVLSKPIIKEGSGKDTILIKREASVSETDLEEMFMKLQTLYRDSEKELNFMKSELKEQVNKINSESEQQFQKDWAEYQRISEEVSNLKRQYMSEFHSWQIQEKERISKLKIIIPKELEPTLELVKSLTSK